MEELIGAPLAVFVPFLNDAIQFAVDEVVAALYRPVGVMLHGTSGEGKVILGNQSFLVAKVLIQEIRNNGALVFCSGGMGLIHAFFSANLVLA